MFLRLYDGLKVKICIQNYKMSHNLRLWWIKCPFTYFSLKKIARPKKLSCEDDNENDGYTVDHDDSVDYDAG